jgi:TetR/AcrR family transcriptional regulator
MARTPPHADRISNSTCESIDFRLSSQSKLCHRNGLLIAPTKTPEPTNRAERTRAAILEAAEQHFARRGFVATRLEDVAAAVDLKRAALFYHFRDKQSLYDAVVANAFGALARRLEEAFSAPVPIPVRTERAVEAWVDTVFARPTLARLILRHAAEAEEHAKHGIFPAADHFLRIGWSLFEEGRASGEFRPVHDDPFHAASAVIGATVFYLAALAPLLPDTTFNPLAPEHVAAHKRDVLRTVRMLLGIAVPDPVRAPAARRRRAGRKTPRKPKRGTPGSSSGKSRPR